MMKHQQSSWKLLFIQEQCKCLHILDFLQNQAFEENMQIQNTSNFATVNPYWKETKNLNSKFFTCMCPRLLIKPSDRFQQCASQLPKSSVDFAELIPSINDCQVKIYFLQDISLDDIMVSSGFKALWTCCYWSEIPNPQLTVANFIFA